MEFPLFKSFLLKKSPSVCVFDLKHGSWRNVQLFDAHDGLIQVVMNSNLKPFSSFQMKCVVEGFSILQLSNFNLITSRHSSMVSTLACCKVVLGSNTGKGENYWVWVKMNRSFTEVILVLSCYPGHMATFFPCPQLLQILLIIILIFLLIYLILTLCQSVYS